MNEVEANALNRQDRIKVIQFSATEAKRQSRDKHLWIYARDDDNADDADDGKNNGNGGEVNCYFHHHHASFTSSSSSSATAGKLNIRKLSMIDLENILIRMGLSSDEIPMHRWDRLQLIEFAEVEAKRLGFHRMWQKKTMQAFARF